MAHPVATGYTQIPHLPRREWITGRLGCRRVAPLRWTTPVKKYVDEPLNVGTGDHAIPVPDDVADDVMVVRNNVGDVAGNGEGDGAGLLEQVAHQALA